MGVELSVCCFTYYQERLKVLRSENRTREASFASCKMTLSVSLVCIPLEGLIMCWLFRLKFESSGWPAMKGPAEWEKSCCRKQAWPLSRICSVASFLGLSGNTCVVEWVIPFLVMGRNCFQINILPFISLSLFLASKLVVAIFRLIIYKLGILRTDCSESIIRLLLVLWPSPW